MSSSDDRRRPRVAGHRRRERPSATEAEPTVVEVEPTVVTAKPTAAEVVAEPAATVAVAEGEQASGRRGVARPFLAPLAALLASLALLAGVAAVSLGDPGAADRDARAATAAARSDLEQLLSYDHQTLEKQAADNAALLTGAFKDEYAQTMRTTILPVATQEKAVVRARTYEAGVMAQTPDTVTVQVFLNQAKTSEGQDQPSVDQNRVIATMQRVDGRWLIAGLKAY